MTTNGLTSVAYMAFGMQRRGLRDPRRGRGVSGRGHGRGLCAAGGPTPLAIIVKRALFLSFSLCLLCVGRDVMEAS